MVAWGFQFYRKGGSRNIFSLEHDTGTEGCIGISYIKLLHILSGRHLHIGNQEPLVIQNKALSCLSGSGINGNSLNLALVNAGIFFRIFHIPLLPDTSRILGIVGICIVSVSCRIILRRSQIPLLFSRNYRSIVDFRLQSIRVFCS